MTPPDSLTTDYRISTVEELEAHYETPPSDRSLAKELDHISGHYRAFIEAAPFVVVASSGAEGLDCSPRGDPAGFVRVADPKTVMMPDRRGNNRLDTLRNLVVDPRISLLFLIPGVTETLRINGTADIITDPDLCASFAMGEKLPRSVIVTRVSSVYYQCPKALVRSKLWDPETQIPRTDLPSAGEMIKGMVGDSFDAEAHDRDYPKHVEKTIY